MILHFGTLSFGFGDAFLSTRLLLDPRRAFVKHKHATVTCMNDGIPGHQYSILAKHTFIKLVAVII